MIKWLDIVDQDELQALVSSSNVQLNSTTRSFLESFASLVNRASNTRRKLLTAAIARKADLHTVTSVIADEVSHLQHQYPHVQIIPYRHPETSLPIIYIRLQAVPDLVVHVFRSYANTRRGFAFGFRAYSFCRGHLTGPLARAANYLRARCTANSWNLSVSELISLWCQQVAAIPDHERQTPIIPRRKPAKMMRRRRQQRPSSPPPHVPDNKYHASLPLDHPKTDVVIKDDKLFPNRTFDDPEELYAEQVRAIRRKRKPVPGVLDDYELAWKKRRPEEHHNPPSEQSQVNPESQSHPQLDRKPHTQPQSSHLHSLFPVQPAANKPSEPETQILSAPKPSESPEEPDFSFLNPLSPESKDTGLGEAQTSSPTEGHLEKAQIAEQDAAKMEAAERAVLSKPADSKNTASSQPPHADSPPCTDDVDDNAHPLFFFSTGMDSHVHPAVDNAPATVLATEAGVRVEGTEKLTGAPEGTEGTEEIIPTTGFQRSIGEEPKLTAEHGKTNSGPKDMQSSGEPSFSFTKRIDDQRHPERDETVTPTPVNSAVTKASPQIPKASEIDKEAPTEAEEDPLREGTSEIRTDPNDAKDTRIRLENPQISRHVSGVRKGTEATDKSSREGTAADSISPACTNRRSSDLSTGNDGKTNDGQLLAEGMRPGSENMELKAETVGRREVAEKVEGIAPMASKKRNREIIYSDDVIIVDPDSDEEESPTKRAKKRRLSPPTDMIGLRGDEEQKDEEIVSPIERDHTGTLQKRRTSEAVDETKNENNVQNVAKSEGDQGKKLVVPEERPERTAERCLPHIGSVTRPEKSGKKQEETGERPSPRNVSIWTPERSSGSPSCGKLEKEETEPIEKENRFERGANSTRDVTRDVEKDPNPFSGFETVSIPAGVDRDPCPMALSEPSESSEESSDHDSDSGAGFASDGTANSEER